MDPAHYEQMHQLLAFTAEAAKVSPLQCALIHWHSVHFLIEPFADKTISLASVARQDGLLALQFLSDVQASLHMASCSAK